MRQEINLFQDELRERKPVLPARQLLFAAVAAVVVMAAVSVWMSQRLDAPRAELARLEAEIQARSASIAALGTRLETHRPDPALALEARRLEQRLEHLQRLAAITVAPAAALPLSAYLEGLGRQRPEGLWLRRIVIANGGADIALDGSALEPGLLPAYLESLGAEQAFAGRGFGELFIERAAADPRWLDFRIAAGCLAAGRGAAAARAPASLPAAPGLASALGPAAAAPGAAGLPPAAAMPDCTGLGEAGG